jgi:subtilisin family serine protease
MKKIMAAAIFLFSLGLFAQNKDYVPGNMLIQFKTELRGSIVIVKQGGIALTGIPTIDEMNRRWQVQEIKKVILDPNPDDIAKRMGLDLLYLFTFPKATDIGPIMAVYQASRYVKYVCPNAIYHIDRIPNDPRYSNQWHLPNIDCPEAWDITTGDTTVVTAIVDMGVDYLHEDLQNSFWINEAEDINHNGRFDPSPPPGGDLNGVDDDTNGYVDDVIGYDFFNGDPDPMPNTPADDHGTHCYGIATATADNNTGIAGVGWNIKGMDLMCGDNSGIYLYPAIAAIYYAADNGAWVISMSYGSYRGQNEAESTALAYAWERGLVECGAAGNDNVTTLHYPSSYSWVISVAASTPNNMKADFSNYGPWIDVCAPGVNILSTIPGNRYTPYDGTSMACPCAAGVAAVIKSAFPAMTNAECTTRMFQSCDTMPDRLYRSDSIGHGRVNVGKAILQLLRSNLSVSGYRINDQSGNNNGVPDPGETVALIITLANEFNWQDASSVTATIENDDPEIEILKNNASFPNIPAGGSANCSADSFVFRVNASSPPYHARFAVNKSANPPTYDNYDNLMVTIGSPRVLLVDDDDGGNLETWYSAAADSLGVLSRIWSIADFGSPPLETLNNYPVVIWLTGLDSTETLTPTDMTNLSSYLDGGGNLFISGQNLGQEIGSQPFYSNYLHARYLANRITTGSLAKVIGIDGDPIGNDDEDTLVMMGTGGANNARSMDGIQPINGAIGSHHYPTNPDTIYAGIHYAGTYKVVYFGFPFEAVDANPTRYSQKWEILRRILVFFEQTLPGVEEKLETTSLVALTISPNPFSMRTVIHFSASAIKNRTPDVYIYNSAGILIKTLNAQHSTGNILIWDGTDCHGKELPDGVYFSFVKQHCNTGVIKTKIIKLK